jgi:hypothetical protein
MTNNKDSLQNKTLTLRDIAPSCKYCGKPIEWQKTPVGKFAPIEPLTGFDHRERCNGMAPTTRTTLRNQNHEASVNNFFRSLGTPLGAGGAPLVAHGSAR